MEAIYFFETSVDFQRSTWRYIPKIELFNIPYTLHAFCDRATGKKLYFIVYVHISYTNDKLKGTIM
jgi:hypothetical protein